MKNTQTKFIAAASNGKSTVTVIAFCHLRKMRLIGCLNYAHYDADTYQELFNRAAKKLGFVPDRRCKGGYRFKGA